MLLCSQAFVHLEAALQEAASIEARIAAGKALLAEMLKSRKDATEAPWAGPKPAAIAAAPAAAADGDAAAAAGTPPSSPPPAGASGEPVAAGEGAAVTITAAAAAGSPTPPPTDEALSDEAIMAMMRREALLTRAKLFTLQHDISTGERQGRATRAAIRLVRMLRTCMHAAWLLYYVHAHLHA